MVRGYFLRKQLSTYIRLRGGVGTHVHVEQWLSVIFAGEVGEAQPSAISEELGRGRKLTTDS